LPEIVRAPSAGQTPNGEAMLKREKLFGLGRPRPLDREGKVRLMHRARSLKRRTAKGRAYGALTAKALDVLEALLWSFHNARSGVCFPSYERIAEAADCARSTVAECLQTLEAAGLLTWVHRLRRVRGHSPHGDGWRWRVLRTSNAYTLWGSVPERPNRSKSEKPTGTDDQAFIPDLSEALGRLERGIRKGVGQGSSIRMATDGC
jgi:hypothetical protein